MNKKPFHFLRDWKEPYPGEAIEKAMAEYGEDAILFQLDNHDDTAWLCICGSEEEAKSIQENFDKELDAMHSDI